MGKKIGQLILLIFLISAAALIQSSFLNVLPSFLGAINLMLIILVFTLFFYDFRSALGVALFGGFWLDLFSFHFFGFYLFSLFFTLAVVAWILRSWLTNRSLYSFGLLIFLATIIYNLIAGLLTYFFAYGSTGFFAWTRHFWLYLFYQSAWCELAALLLFNFAGAATRRLKPFFLEKA
jgi:cell shape-determining protein MreD